MALPTLATPVAGGARPTEHDPLARWRQGVTIAPVSAVAAQHTIHAYYTACPESPDGSRVVFYASTTPEGYTGEIHVLDRRTGEETAPVRNDEVEDAHRAACQQWVSAVRPVAFHDVRDGRC